MVTSRVAVLSFLVFGLALSGCQRDRLNEEWRVRSTQRQADLLTLRRDELQSYLSHTGLIGTNRSMYFTQWLEVGNDYVFANGFLVNQTSEVLGGRFSLEARYGPSSKLPTALDLAAEVRLSADAAPFKRPDGLWTRAEKSWDALTDPSAKTISLLGTQVDLGPIKGNKRSILFASPYPIPMNSSTSSQDLSRAGKFIKSDLRRICLIVADQVLTKCEVGVSVRGVGTTFEAPSTPGGCADGFIVSGDAVVGKVTITDEGARTHLQIDLHKGGSDLLQPSFRVSPGELQQVQVPDSLEGTVTVSRGDDSLHIAFDNRFKDHYVRYVPKPVK